MEVDLLQASRKDDLVRPKPAEPEPNRVLRAPPAIAAGAELAFPRLRSGAATAGPAFMVLPA